MNIIEILDIAVQSEGSQAGVAEALEVSPQVISNWRRRGQVPHMATRLLKSMYAKQITAAARAAKEIK
jgi:DNA-binding transcriptional regulator YiaG